MHWSYLLSGLKTTVQRSQLVITNTQTTTRVVWIRMLVSVEVMELLGDEALLEVRDQFFFFGSESILEDLT